MKELILANIFCITILAILLLGINMQKGKNEKTSKWFSLLASFLIIFEITNIASELCEGRPDYTIESYIINALSFIIIDFLEISFVGYIHSLLGEVNHKNSRALNFVVLMCSLEIVGVIVLTITGNLFTIKDGYYVEGKLILIPYFLSLFFMIVMLSIVIANREFFGKRELIVICFYLVLPLAPIVIETIFDLYSLTPMALTLSVLLVYVLIQASAIEGGIIRESVLEEISNTDLLTNAKNRRAYYKRIADLDVTKEVGIIFCDINGLKYTNDHLGHTAGDELIQRLAKVLGTACKEKDVFRISGDEFVCICEDNTEKDFNDRVYFLKDLIYKNKQIASLGCARGKASSFDELVKKAEAMMYKEKTEYHLEHQDK